MSEKKRNVEIFRTSERGYVCFGYADIEMFLKKRFDMYTPELNYHCVHKSEMMLRENDIESLNMLYRILNINPPEDYKPRSLLVSDIVKLDNNYYFVDSYGFKEVTKLPGYVSNRLMGLTTGLLKADDKEIPFLLNQIKELELEKANTFYSLGIENIKSMLPQVFEDLAKSSYDCEIEKLELDILEHLKTSFYLDNWKELVSDAIKNYLTEISTADTEK